MSENKMAKIIIFRDKIQKLIWPKFPDVFKFLIEMAMDTKGNPTTRMEALRILEKDVARLIEKIRNEIELEKLSA